MNNTDQQGVKDEVKAMAEKFATTCFSKHTFRWQKVVQYYTQGIYDWMAKKIFEDLASHEEKSPFSMPTPIQEPFALQSLSGKENKIPDDFYPGYEYQNLFNWLSDKNFSALQSEMQELIEIVHRDFPKEQSGEQLSAGRWVKASERLPESTRGYAKQIVTKWTFEDGNIQLRTTTSNELIDVAKNIIDLHKIEWLDESQPEDTHIILNRLQEYGNRSREIERLKGLIENREQTIEKLIGVLEDHKIPADVYQKQQQ